MSLFVIILISCYLIFDDSSDSLCRSGADSDTYPPRFTRVTDEETVVYTEAQTLEAGEITHLTIEHIPCNEIQSGPVLLYIIAE